MSSEEAVEAKWVISERKSFSNVTFRIRNRIECWFGILKAGTKRFSNNFQTTQPSKAQKPS